MGADIKINDYLITTIESIFSEMKSAEYQEVFDASVYLYNFVKNEGIYPQQVVEGFYSAMAIISGMTISQFYQIKSFYV